MDPRLIRAGEFRWLWYKLIPANAETLVFRLDPVTRRFTAKNSLPSGDTYAAFAGSAADFSWEIDAALSFAIDPDSLIGLVSGNTLGGQEALDAWEGELAEKMGALVLRRLGSGETDQRYLEDILKTGSSPELEREIQGQFPMARDVSCVFSAVKFPDFALYTRIRGLYEDFIDRQREFMSGALGRQAENRIEERMRFDELEQYGALLAKYPILLEYLALERGIPKQTE